MGAALTPCILVPVILTAPRASHAPSVQPPLKRRPVTVRGLGGHLDVAQHPSWRCPFTPLCLCQMCLLWSHARVSLRVPLPLWLGFCGALLPRPCLRPHCPADPSLITQSLSGPDPSQGRAGGARGREAWGPEPPSIVARVLETALPQIPGSTELAWEEQVPPLPRAVLRRPWGCSRRLLSPSLM